MKTIFLSLLAVAVFTQGLVAQDNVLRWGSDPDSNAPFSFFERGENGALTGFEYDIITAVAKQMGREPVFVRNDWDGLIPGLARGLYDVVICGIEINAQHAAEVDFSMPYYVTFEQLVLRAGEPEVTSLDQLKGKSIGTLDQTAALRMLKATPGVNVKAYDEEVNAYQDTANGRIDGVLLDYPIALYYATPMHGLEFVPKPFGQISYGVAMEKGNTALQQEINNALAEVIASGEMRDILSRWKLWTPAVAQAFNQPAEPSLPPTSYEAFMVAAATQPTLVERLWRYWGFLPFLAEGAWVTLYVSLLSMIIAVSVGFLSAIMRVFGPWPLRWVATIYIEVIRGTPLFIQLLIIFYGLPNIGIKLDPLVAGLLGLGLNYGAYEAENYRAGLMSIPKGQMEAARALGMTQAQGLRFVVIPQAFRLVLPPVTNDFISLLKDSSLVSMITILDLTGAYRQLATTYYDYFGTGLLVAAVYLLLGLPFVRLARWTEQRLAVDTRRPGHRPGMFALPKGKKKA